MLNWEACGKPAGDEGHLVGEYVLEEGKDRDIIFLFFSFFLG
jgi:hypothetical protein